MLLNIFLFSIIDIFCYLLLLLRDLYKIKTYEHLIVRKLFSNGASERDRTAISTLARSYTNHCTTPA